MHNPRACGLPISPPLTALSAALYLQLVALTARLLLVFAERLLSYQLGLPNNGPAPCLWLTLAIVMSLIGTLYTKLLVEPAKAAMRGLGSVGHFLAAAATTVVVVVATSIYRRNRPHEDSRRQPLLQQVGAGNGYARAAW